MVRAYQDRPVSPEALERILEAGRGAPSAGFSQGFAFLVLTGPEETGGFWKAVAHAEERWPNEELRRAPALIVPLAGKDVYLDR